MPAQEPRAWPRYKVASVAPRIGVPQGTIVRGVKTADGKFLKHVCTEDGKHSLGGHL